MPELPDRPLTVVGIGADGWDGLSPTASAALRDADVVVGSPRQLALVTGHVKRTEAWPAPMAAALPGLVDRFPGSRIGVLASGDPMFYGVGAALVRTYGADRVRVLPHPSSVSLACARLGWDAVDVEVVSAVGRPLAALRRWTQPGRRLLVLVSEPDGAARVSDLLRTSGFGRSRVTVLQQLGGPDEQRVARLAVDWGNSPHDALAVVGVECVADNAEAWLSRTPGLPDSAYDSDGALTKQEVRAVTLAALGPLPGELLWDVGSGSGSIAIEWMRTHPANRAIAIEVRADRRARIATNAENLGVPTLSIVAEPAPESLRQLPRPDAIFVGGGVTTPGVLDACLDAISHGGRLVANGVTIETESLLAQWHQRLGGRLTRIAIGHAEPMGTFTSFRPALPVTQWSYRVEVGE